MLSLFPTLLSWNQLSPLFIRLSLSAVLLFSTYKVLSNKKTDTNSKIIAVIETLAGAFVLIGLWTQAAALVVIIDMLVRLIFKIRERTFLSDGVNYYLLLLVMAISILLTGPGSFSFDLPL
ncbi:MAG: hypothetical protein A3B11_00725 [Candidatus Taylorbacteria bacterium RIFCSPLOWO2_01_FULL_44_26]|uniref:Uncharacterized protein n=2 Tax=Candidatus Tayloriibacteriota TaxID=1817919 RepID=A0A1G2MNA1_9BACT|nr:MAG: hypothetical protein A3D50_00640 [Candidatus Taylorbacteria bacterium RIFCSPHIGHO2_02_FULL_44_12]OHA31206.1 MAG: hypothetical protein A3B11_00725 [Candidatus Taylorbacteria bacterium RIFCSPLOWO2_01_FULL_44_26]